MIPEDQKFMAVEVETGEVDSLWVQKPIQAILMNMLITMFLLGSTIYSLWEHRVGLLIASATMFLVWRFIGKYYVLGFPRIRARHQDLMNE